MLSLPSHVSPEALTGFFSFLTIIRHMATQITSQKDLPISPSQEKVNAVIAYLQEHVHENVTVSELASRFYLNPDYLARLFKSHMHVSIGHYVTLQKISAAQALLRDGKSVAEAQELLGYSSYAYFFKTFQKITGLSPSQYRKRHHGL